MIYTLLAGDGGPPFSFDSFLWKVISDLRVLSTKAEKKYNKRSGAGLCMAPQWLHLCGQVPVNRAEQSLSLSAWAVGQAPRWLKQLIPLEGA